MLLAAKINRYLLFRQPYIQFFAVAIPLKTKRPAKAGPWQRAPLAPG